MPKCDGCGADCLPEELKMERRSLRTLCAGCLSTIQAPVLYRPQDEGWYCRRCHRFVQPQDVTYLETHDERKGGCGCPVSDPPVQLGDCYGTEEPMPYIQIGKQEAEELAACLKFLRMAQTVSLAAGVSYIEEGNELDEAERCLSDFMASLDHENRFWPPYDQKIYRAYLAKEKEAITNA